MMTLWLIQIICLHAATCSIEHGTWLAVAYIHDPGRELRSLADCRRVARTVIEPGTLANCQYEEWPQ